MNSRTPISITKAFQIKASIIFSSKELRSQFDKLKYTIFSFLITSYSFAPSVTFCVNNKLFFNNL